MPFQILRGKERLGGTLPPSEAVGAYIVVGGHELDEKRCSPADILAYLKGLKVTQGRLAGSRFKVLPWQRQFVTGAFVDNVQSAALSVARGNGKTALLSGIACATLDGPLMVPRGETIIVASSFEQARIAFEHVIAFMGDKLDDRKCWKVTSGELLK